MLCQLLGHGRGWQGYKKLANVSLSCLAEKLNIKRTIDNKGQNENFFNGESNMKLKIETSH